jgi:hypothetical protein
VPIYFVAKTIADLFRNSSSLDRSIAMEGRKAALTTRKATPSEIFEAAMAGGALTAIKPYLEAFIANGRAGTLGDGPDKKDFEYIRRLARAVSEVNI